MDLLQQIYLWSRGLPRWQSDAVARLLAHGTLNATDKDDLYALLKAAHGIVDPLGRVAVPLGEAQVPAATAPKVEVTLLAVKNLRHVNALAGDHRLRFAEHGVTVIYGENGAGKSGYTRLLKHACRARDQEEKIHPNANAPKGGDASPAEADFELLLSGAPEEVHWKDGITPPAPLSSIAIFDTRCARAYLDEEDDFSYVPYGLDVFDGLAALCNELKARLTAEQKQNVVDLEVFRSLRSTTAVGELVAALSSETQASSIEALAALTLTDTARHAALGDSLKVENPQEKARQLQLRARRLSAMAASLQQHELAVGSAAVAEIESRFVKMKDAAAAAQLAAQEFSAGEHLLPGTGGRAWRALFEAARQFARESHAECVFPNLPSAAPCPLCQQPLAAGAERLTRFEAFIEQAAERELALAKGQFEAVYLPLAKAEFRLNPDDVAELELVESAFAESVRAFEDASIERQKTIVAAVAVGEWSGIATAAPCPTDRVTQVVAALKVEIDALMGASNAATRVDLQREFEELDARVRLGPFKGALLKAVETLRYNANLARCINALSTKKISLKAAEMTESVVSANLAQALNQEFSALSASGLRVTLDSRVHKGKPCHKLTLKLGSAHEPNEILSEGEQRSIAIASFLAEVGLSGGKGAVVFDDPVSSLDHLRRDAVARRLVSEARYRQVIVFTHCLFFAYLLDEESKRQDVPLLMQNLVRKPGGLGVAEEGLPFEGKKTAERVGALKQCQVKIAKLQECGQDAERKTETVLAYTALRTAWERAVEEVLFNEAVLRFRKGVETQRLAKVRVEDDDYNAIHAGMTRCSNFVHDQALMGSVALPEPAELLADIEALEKWRLSVVNRNTATGRARKH